MNLIARFNEENRWRNLTLGAILLFTSCREDIHIRDKNGKPVSIEKYKGKTIEVTIDNESVVGLDPIVTKTEYNPATNQMSVSTSPRLDFNQNYDHNISVVDSNGNIITFHEIEYMNAFRKYQIGQKIHIIFDEKGNVKATK